MKSKSTVYRFETASGHTTPAFLNRIFRLAGRIVCFAIGLLAVARPCLAQSPTPPVSPLPLKEAAIPADVNVLRNVEIGKGGERVLHANIAWPKFPPKVPMSAIIDVHGGGWRRGSNELTSVALRLASLGFFVASVEYRLSGEAKWPAQIEDCKLAVRWLRANAAKYNINPNRIGCMGISAGGHLVACMGVMNAPDLEGHGGYEGVSSKVQAVVDFCGPADLTNGNFGNGSPYVSDQMRAHDLELLLELFGTSFSQNPGLYSEASPIVHVKQDNPPFLVIHGVMDQIVAYSQAEKFVAALQNAKVPVDLITVKDGKHGVWPPHPCVPIAAFFKKSLTN